MLGKTLINTRVSWTEYLLTLLTAGVSAKSAYSLLPTSQHAINKQPEDNEKVKKQIDKNKRRQQIDTIVFGLVSGFSARTLYKGHQTKKRLVSHLTRASSKGRRSRHSSRKTSKSK